MKNNLNNSYLRNYNYWQTTLPYETFSFPTKLKSPMQEEANE